MAGREFRRSARNINRLIRHPTGRGPATLAPNARDPIPAARGVGLPTETPIAAGGGGGGPVSPLVEVSRTETNVIHAGTGATCEVVEALVASITYVDAVGKQYVYQHQVTPDG